MPSELIFTRPESVAAEADLLLVLGRKARLLQDDVRAWLPPAAAAVWPAMVDSLRPKDAGDAALTWLAPEGPRLVAAAVSDRASRHNSPARPDVVAELVGKWAAKGRRVAVLAAVEDAGHAVAVAAAVARALPLYSNKRPAGDEADNGGRKVALAMLAPGGRAVEPSELLQVTADGVRLAARLVDTPTADLGTDEVVAAAEEVASSVGARCQVIRGEELRDQGFGGLWGVGKAARKPPALVVLGHEPKGAQRTVAWIGKGIVYDTGGLSLKPRDAMAGMKRDMGGAAAVLAAFQGAVRLRFPDRLHALLCLAENAIGPDAVRPDDILAMYSGKTVEVNNTDAEGRLVLADGIAYAGKHLEPDLTVDLATLTGAQLIATGRRHAAIISDDEALEAAAVRAGLASGDLVHPLPYCPELYRREYKSELADMKNSVKDRANAQTSVAAQFVAEHRVGKTGRWLHVDIAGPVHVEERASGFGVAFLLELCRPGGALG